MNKITSKLSKKYKSKDILKVEWFMIICVACIASVSLMFMDVQSLSVWSVNFLEAVFTGQPLDFYKINVENSTDIVHKMVGYNVFPIAIWAIWNIPVWIMQHFFGKNLALSPILLTYSKMFTVILFVACLFLAYKICMMIFGDKNKSMWVAFLSASSSYALMLYFAGQNDILAIFFSLLAIYYLFKKERGRAECIKFYVFASCAIAVKPYVMFAFIAIILLYEKNIMKICLKVLSGTSITVICTLIYRNAPMYKESMEYAPLQGNLEQLFSTAVPMYIGSGSLFVLCLIVLYFVCYVIRVDETEKPAYVIYAVALTYVFLMIWTAQSFYRVLYLVPFIYMVMERNGQYRRINIILESVAAVSLLCVQSLDGGGFLVPHLLHLSLVGRILGLEAENVWHRWNPLRDWILYKFPFFEMFINAFTALFAGCLIILMVINCPLLKRQEVLVNDKCERWIIWLRILVPLPFIAMSYYVGYGG